MKKITVRFLGLMLAIALVFGSVVSAFAFSKGKTKHYEVYTCLGDSNAAGYGTSDYAHSPLPSATAYHSLVANALDAELRLLGYGAFRTEDMLYMLDPEYDMDWAFSFRSTNDIHQEALDDMRKDYVQAVKDADLITIQIGANDISEKIAPAFAAMSAPIPAIEAIKAKVTNQTLLTIIGLVDQIAKLVNTAITLYNYGKEATAEYGPNFDRIIENIVRINPDADIVVLSITNPLHNVYLAENLKLEIGNIYSLASGQVNNWLKYKSTVRDKYIYCDLSGIQYPSGSMANLLQDTELQFYVIHMLDDGHAQVADRILNVLPKE